MFNLFGKKKEAPKAQQPAAQAAQLAQGFDKEELSILAVTGPRGIFGQKDRWGTDYSALELTAWMETDTSTIHQGNFQLVLPADQELLTYIRGRIPRDFIIKFNARLSPEGDRLLLLSLPTPAFDPALKALLEEQKKPVTRQAEGLGDFTLNRSVGVFQGEVDWLGQPAQLCIDRDEFQESCLQVARQLLAGAARWDEQARTMAADKLLDTANQWAQDNDEEPVTREEFTARIGLETIDVSADGSFHLWYNDGDLFFGQLIQVDGALTGGISDASMEG